MRISGSDRMDCRSARCRYETTRCRWDPEGSGCAISAGALASEPRPRYAATEFAGAIPSSTRWATPSPEGSPMWSARRGCRRLLILVLTPGPPEQRDIRHALILMLTAVHGEGCPAGSDAGGTVQRSAARSSRRLPLISTTRSPSARSPSAAFAKNSPILSHGASPAIRAFLNIIFGF